MEPFAGQEKRHVVLTFISHGF